MRASPHYTDTHTHAHAHLLTRQTASWDVRARPCGCVEQITTAAQPSFRTKAVASTACFRDVAASELDKHNDAEDELEEIKIKEHGRRVDARVEDDCCELELKKVADLLHHAPLLLRLERLRVRPIASVRGACACRVVGRRPRLRQRRPEACGVSTHRRCRADVKGAAAGLERAVHERAPPVGVTPHLGRAG